MIESINSNKRDFKLVNKVDLYMGPKKSAEQTRIDIALGNHFKALCKLRGISFARGERQKTKAMSVGIQRCFRRNIIWVDDMRTHWWCDAECEVRWSTEKLQALQIDVEQVRTEAIAFSRPRA